MQEARVRGATLQHFAGIPSPLGPLPLRWRPWQSFPRPRDARNAPHATHPGLIGGKQMFRASNIWDGFCSTTVLDIRPATDFDYFSHLSRKRPQPVPLFAQLCPEAVSDNPLGPQAARDEALAALSFSLCQKSACSANEDLGSMSCRHRKRWKRPPKVGWHWAAA